MNEANLVNNQQPIISYTVMRYVEMGRLGKKLHYGVSGATFYL